MASVISDGEKRLIRIQGVIDGCEDIINSPESNGMIKKCAIETAYKHIVRIMRGENANNEQT